MKSLFLGFILVLITNLGSAGEFSSFDLREPLLRLAVVAYFDQVSNQENSQIEAGVLQQIENALLNERRTYVASLSEYIRLRNLVPETIGEYRKQIQQNGLVNPLTITTPNSKVFEEIVEYEVHRTQELINGLPKNIELTFEMRAALETAQKMIAVYNLGLGMRDGLDGATRSWQGVPVLGLLRSLGENVVNPIVRGTLYSGPMMNLMREELRRRFSISRRQVLQNSTSLSDRVRETGFSQFEKEWSSLISKMDFLKPLKELETSIVLDLVVSFFKSLPDVMKQDIVWYWINHPQAIDAIKASPNNVVLFFKNQHPHSIELIRYFDQWLRTPKIKTQIQNLSALPIWEITQSLVQIMKQMLLAPLADSKPSLLGDLTSRNWFGQKQYRVQVFSVSLDAISNLETTMSLGEFAEKHPLIAPSLKRKLAQIVLHNTFQFGLRSIISPDVRVRYLSTPNDFEVLIPKLEALASNPVDQTQRFIGAIARLPLPLMGWPAGDHRAVARFLEEPENLLWAMQFYQLNHIVGEDILKSELKAYVLRHPNIVISFVKKKWFSQKSEPAFLGRSNSCQSFYN